MVDALFDKPVPWLNGSAPESDLVLCSLGVLHRNLADLPFPSRCSEDEKRTVEERVIQALNRSGVIEGGQYVTLDDLADRELGFLSECTAEHSAGRAQPRSTDLHRGCHDHGPGHRSRWRRFRHIELPVGGTRGLHPPYRFRLRHELDRRPDVG